MKCDFEKLVSYLDEQLDLDGQLEVLDHLDTCEPCFEAVYQLTRERDFGLYVRDADIEDSLVAT